MLIGIRLYRTMPEANNNTSAIAYVTSSAERSREGGGGEHRTISVSSMRSQAVDRSGW